MELNKIYLGDNTLIIKQFEDCGIDSLVTDPPYGISFMNKKWDYDLPNVDFWREVLRVLKPGAFGLVACGTRTQHRMAVNLEDAGFEIRDIVAWVYGCLSEDTEILTVDGWKRYDIDITSSPIICYIADTDNFAVAFAEEKYIYENQHPAYRIKGDNTDQIVSRNHRCIIEYEGKRIFQYAERLQTEAYIPILEDLCNMPKTIPHVYSETGSKEQVLFTRLHKHNYEGKKEKRNNTSWRVYLSRMWQKISGREKKKPEVLFQSLQWENKGDGTFEIFPSWQKGVDGGVNSKPFAKNERGKKPCMERRNNLFQKAWKLPTNKICEMSRRIYRYGEKRWLYNGAQANGGERFGEMSIEGRSGSPHKSQPTRQQDRELNAIPKQQGTQIIRVAVEQVEYKGKMWCVRVPTGAFVARRNGKIFVTGNSGFPKSLNIGKSIDKTDGTVYPKNEVISSNTSMTGANYTRRTIPIQSENAKRFEGWGTALKPAMELFTLVRKPIAEKNVALNVLKYGTGGLNFESDKKDYRLAI